MDFRVNQFASPIRSMNEAVAQLLDLFSLCYL